MSRKKKKISNIYQYIRLLTFKLLARYLDWFQNLHEITNLIVMYTYVGTIFKKKKKEKKVLCCTITILCIRKLRRVNAAAFLFI